MKVNFNIELDTDNESDLKKIEEIMALLQQIKEILEEGE